MKTVTAHPLQPAAIRTRFYSTSFLSDRVFARDWSVTWDISGHVTFFYNHVNRDVYVCLSVFWSRWYESGAHESTAPLVSKSEQKSKLNGGTCGKNDANCSVQTGSEYEPIGEESRPLLAQVNHSLSSPATSLLVIIIISRSVIERKVSLLFSTLTYL